MALHRFVQGKVSDIARALAQQRMIAQTLDGQNVGQLADFMESQSGYRTPEDIIRHAKNTSRRVEAAESIGENPNKAVAESLKPAIQDYFKVGVEYWMNNILSGVETHAVNFMGSPMVQLYEGVIIRNLAAGIGAARKATGVSVNLPGIVKGKPFNFRPKKPKVGASIEELDRYDQQSKIWEEQVNLHEQVARTAGAFIGLRDGYTAFIDSIVTGQSQFGPEKGEELRGGEKGNTAAKLATGSFRLLGAEDAFWKTNIFRSEFSSLIIRDAYAKGLDPAKHLDDAFKNPNRYEKHFDQAMEYSRKYTFTETDRPGFIGDMTRAMKKFSAVHPPVKFITPFIDTPGNLVHYAVENSVLGLTTKHLRDELAKGGARADIANARLVAGMSLTLASYVAANSIVQGQGPENWKERELMQLQGSPGSAMFIGGKYYTVKRLDPFATSVFAYVNAIEAAKYARTEQEAMELFATAAIHVAKHASDATYMQGFSKFLEVLEDPGRLKTWSAAYMPGLVPYSGLIKTVSKFTDPQPKVTTKDRKFENDWTMITKQKIAAGIPFQDILGIDIRPGRYWDGSLKLPSGGTPVHQMTILDKIENAISPIKGWTPNEFEDKETSALAANGMAPREPNPILTIGKGKGAISLSILTIDNGNSKLYDKFVKDVGAQRRENINALINSSEWRDLDAGPGSTQHAELQKALSKAKKQAIGHFLMETLPEFMALNPDKIQPFVKMWRYYPEELYYMWKNDDLAEDVLDKIEVRGESEVGSLPQAPIHLRPEHKSTTKGPRFK